MTRMKLTGTKPKRSSWTSHRSIHVELVDEFHNVAHTIRYSDLMDQPKAVEAGKRYFNHLLREYAKLPHRLRWKKRPKGTWGESWDLACLAGVNLHKGSRCVRAPRWMWASLKKAGIV